MKLLFQIVAVIGLVLLAAAGVMYIQSASFISRAKLTTGTVVSLFAATDPDTNSRYYCPLISFTTPAGQTYTVEGNTCSAPAPYIVGDLVNLYYDPQNPHDAQVKSFGAQYLLAASLFIPGLILIVLGAAGLLYLRRKARPTDLVIP